MVYLLIGKDNEAKDKRIEQLKTECLSSSDALNFDLCVLHAHRLDAQELKKNLISLPTIAKRRFVLIHVCHKLKPDHKKIILGCLQENHDHLALVLESDEMGSSDSFAKALNPFCELIQFAHAPQKNVFDMTRAISMRRPQDALKILAGLIASGDHPLKIMGGIVWFWGRAKTRVSKENFKKGLIALQEADFNIKRSRLKPDQALEVLVVKLCSFI